MASHSHDSGICCHETSVRNYHKSLRNDPEERSYQLLRGGSLKSRSLQAFFTRTNRHSTLFLVEITFHSRTVLTAASELLPALTIHLDQIWSNSVCKIFT